MIMQCDVFKITKENWSGSYELSGYHKGIEHEKLVKVSFYRIGPNPPQNRQWRVCIWGNDDFGMEKDFYDMDLAWSCFIDVINFQEIEIQKLIKIGFLFA